VPELGFGNLRSAGFDSILEVGDFRANPITPLNAVYTIGAARIVDYMGRAHVCLSPLLLAAAASSSTQWICCPVLPIDFFYPVFPTALL
jgi:hypothetical protein